MIVHSTVSLGGLDLNRSYPASVTHHESLNVNLLTPAKQSMDDETSKCASVSGAQYMFNTEKTIYGK